MSRNIWISKESSRKFQNLLTIWEPCAITVITARRVASLHQSLWTCKHQSVRTSAGCSVLRLREVKRQHVSSAPELVLLLPPLPVRPRFHWGFQWYENTFAIKTCGTYPKQTNDTGTGAPCCQVKQFFSPTLLERLQMRALKDVSLCYSPASTPLHSNCKVCHWCESYHTRTSPHQTPPPCAVRGSRAAKFFQFY